MKPSLTSIKLSARELCLLSLMGALMLAFQVVMASLPNVHVTALLIILTTVFFGWKALFSVAVFVLLEGLVWGFGVWWLSYCYVWPLLVAVAVLLRPLATPVIWAVVAGVHGLLFGALCSLPYIFIGGFEMAFSYWVSGLVFDLLQCAGNFVLTLLLYKPLFSVINIALRKRSE